MKKSFVILALASMVSSPVFAENFKGFAVGIDAEARKYRLDTEDEKLKKSATVPHLSVSYGTGQDRLVGIAEAKIAATKNKVMEEADLLLVDEEGEAFPVSGKVEQKNELALGYLVGYKVTEQFVPYGKVDYRLSQVKHTVQSLETQDSESLKDNMKGFGFGLGAKYAITPNVEIGAEYLHNRLKTQKSKDKVSSHNVSLGAAYRF